MRKNVIKDKFGVSVGDEMNRLINIIEKTPIKTFIENKLTYDSMNKVNLVEMSYEERMEFLEKNPKAMFSYAKNDVISSVFTNFSVNKDRSIIFYDIIRLIPFDDSENSLIVQGDDLVRVKEFHRHTGLGLNQLQGIGWHHINFLNPSFSFLNWNKISWEDLK
jgi:hypothetical protein